MHGASRQRQWRRLKRQINDHHDLLEDLKRDEIEFRKYSNWDELIGAFKKADWAFGRSDAMLRPLIMRLRQETNKGWQDILTVMLWHMLCTIYKRLEMTVRDDKEKLDDLWVDIHWRFLECLFTIDIGPKAGRIAYRLYVKIKDLVRDGFRSRRKEERRWLAYDSVASEEIIGPVRMYDSRDISLSARLSLYLRTGILKLVEYEIIKSLTLGSETLTECADRLSIDDEVAKKIRQRAIKKIQNIEINLSPFDALSPLLLIRGRSYGKKEDDEESDYGTVSPRGGGHWEPGDDT